MDSIVKLEGKPIEKLIDTVSNTIGNFCEPWLKVRAAKAEAKIESIKAIEKAKTEAIINGDLQRVEYLHIVENRLVTKEVKRQKNIEEVISNAKKILEAEKEVSEEKVDPDWTARFFNIVQDVSNEDMQLLWGQILAGEVKQPKSYSLRTLELLRNMTQEEAELFQKVAQFNIQCNNEAFIFSSDDFLKSHGISYTEIAKLIEFGLLQSGDFVHEQIKATTSESDEICLVYGNILIIIRRSAYSPKLSIPVRLFSTSGKELTKLVTITPDLDYIKALANTIRHEKVKIYFAKINSIDKNGVVNYNSATMKEL